jgi:putative queuosine salvage protein
VASLARFVHVDEDRLDTFAADLFANPWPRPTPPVPPTWGEQTLVAWVLTFAAVNFGSGWFPHLRKLAGRSGSITLMTRLAERFVAEGPLPPARLADINARECADIFGQDMAPPVDELMRLFAKGFQDLGDLLNERYDARFEALVEQAGHSAERLCHLMTDMPLFRDIPSYRGFDVPMWKRAQIVGSDLALALDDRGLGCFTDLDRLTLFADNLVPHVLRIEGVLVVDSALCARIERGDLIESGCEEEVEIRAVALDTIERVITRLRSAGYRVNARDLDYLLWNRGQEQRYKSRPRHRTRCTFY